MRICFVLPTKNEEKSIGQIIDQIRSEVQKLNHEIVQIIVSDDSKDETRKIVKDKGAKYIIGGGIGLGYAMYKGLKYAASLEPDVIVSMDSDGQVDISELKNFLLPIEQDQADMVLGSRFLEKDLVNYKYKFINRTGVRILSRIISKLAKINVTDSHGGMRALRPEIAKELQMIGNHTYVQETIIDASEKGFRIKEIPSKWLPREYGNSRVVLSIPKYIFYTLPVLILRAGSHINILFPIGIFFFFLSILDFIIVGVDTRFSFAEMIERRSFVYMILLFSIGINVLFFGFILELIGHIKRRLDQ